jgi:hypothetical protein
VFKTVSLCTALLGIGALAGCGAAGDANMIAPRVVSGDSSLDDAQGDKSSSNTVESSDQCSIAQSGNHDRNSYLGETPPDIVSEKEHWAGTAPPSLVQLKGKVVWLHFNF